MKVSGTKIQYTAIFCFFNLLGLSSIAQDNSVALRVNLYPIQTLVITPAQKNITLNYATKKDYADGVVAEQTDHLTIYSTSGFQVKVSSCESAAENHFPLSSISVLPSSGSKPIEQGGVEYLEKNLSGQEQPIITSNTGALNKNFNILYKGAGANMYVNYAKSTDATTTYSYQIMYTIVSQ